jgi:flavin-dependent dehydrogenase
MDHDVIAVIGASSSGLYAAWRLAEAGRDVVLYEKNDAATPHSRRLIVTPYLSRLCTIPPSLVLNEVDTFRFISDGLESEIALEEPDLIIERAGLIQWLMGRAREAGVQVLTGWSFIGLANGSKGLRVRLQKQETRKEDYLAPTCVVGADGPCSEVGRAIGQVQARVGLAQTKVRLTNEYPTNRVTIWFRTDLTPYFFWLFPDSAETGMVGTIADSERAARKLIEQFTEEMGWSPMDYESGESSLYTRGPRPELSNGKTRVYLVGDAAGQVKVTTIGGTVTGLRGAEACVQSILKGTSYRRELSPVRRELWVHRSLRCFLNSLSDGQYGDLLSYAARNEELISSFSRDEFTPHLIQLFLSSPGLSIRALKSLLFNI